jgi:hypothetical protein
MGTEAGAIEYCEHGEMQVACLECLAMPKKVAPQQVSAPRATKNPSSENDKISPLGGDLDMSLPVDIVDGWVGSDWLTARTFPHYLRRSGWVYLRCNGSLQARVKAIKVVWRCERKVPTEGPYVDLGPGMALQIDPRTWDDTIDIPLGDLADQQEHGFRYLLADEDGTVVHYRGGRPVPDRVDDDLD